MNNGHDYLLTLAIPTYNRGKILDEALETIRSQLSSVNQPIELIVSDNCSPDNTEEVVRRKIESGMEITYIRNRENLGMDGNFVQCFRRAKGKYVWVLGDDDHLSDGSLAFILGILEHGNYGLVHIKMRHKKKTDYEVHGNLKKFISDMSYWVTFISANIVNTRYVPMINFENYFGTYFTLVPLYMTAAINEEKNIMIHRDIFSDSGIDHKSNGGYNYFEVFINNYLTIWRSFSVQAHMGTLSYELEKFRVFRGHIIHFTYHLIFKRKKGNYRTDRCWYYLFKFFWYYPYFYLYLAIYFLKLIAVRIKTLIFG